MENETAQEAPRSFASSPWLIALALGTYFAWWNLYHDEGFLFLDDYLNQVVSCISCYGGALIAGALMLGLKKSWEACLKPWLTALGITQLLCGALFYGAVALQMAAGIIALQLLLSTSFFITLFFLMRKLASQPLPRAALLIAGGIGLYGLLASLVWAVTMIAPSLLVRIVSHAVLFGGGFAMLWITAIRSDGLTEPESLPVATADCCNRIPLPLILHIGAYWFVFGVTHAMASGIIPIGHDKLLPCYLGSIAASLVFYAAFARSGQTEKLWPKVRACIFPLTMLSFLLLPFANNGFTFISIGFAQCAMDTYLAFYLLATLAIARKIGWGFTRTAVFAAFLSAPFIIFGVVTGDALKASLNLSPLFYNVLSVLAFALLAAGTFWIGDDRRVGLVRGLEKKLSPKRFEDKETAERCTKAAKEFGLTKREGEILLFLAQGLNASAIAEAEVISLNTARTHISRIHRKMDVHNQQELLKRLKRL